MPSPRPPSRLALAHLPTPLEPADRLGAALGFDAGMLWIKRDDLTGLAGGGNKARKLEFLVGDALDRGCDTLVTGGGAQSNHVRMTGAAARRAGLRCVAVLGGSAPAVPDGNLILDHLLGVEPVWVGRYEVFHIEQVLAETCLRLASEGARPYEVPLGGASPTGTLGYVQAAAEIASQAPLGSVIYTATGTGGTQAGLAVGFGHHDRVRGVGVAAIPDVAERIGELVPAVASLAHVPFPSGSIQLDHGHAGDGYGSCTPGALEALRLTADHEGVLLDPVYSAKAMAALVADRRSGKLAPDQPTVFLHTGGLPGLFAAPYVEWLTST